MLDRIKNLLGIITSKKAIYGIAASAVLVLVIKEPKLVAAGITLIACAYIIAQGYVDSKKQ